MIDRLHWELYRRRQAELEERATSGAYLAGARRRSPRRPEPGRGSRDGR